MTNLGCFTVLAAFSTVMATLVSGAEAVQAGDGIEVRSVAHGNPGEAAAAKEAVDAGAVAAPGHPPIHETELRIARSGNGIDFTDSGRMLARGAFAPALARLHDGTLLALFDFADGEVADPDEVQTVIAASFSKDAGRSWSSPRPIQIRTRSGTPGVAEHAALLRMPGGLLRLYYVTREERVADREPASPGRRVVMGAISYDGLTFRVDPRVRIELESDADVHPMVAMIDSRVHLFIGGFGSGARGDETAPRPAWHYLSPTGRRFTKIDEPLPPGAAFVGSVIHGRFGTRAYVSSDEGIVSYLSKDGWRFAAEKGVRVANGWDPATLRLHDGSYLMIYCARVTEQSKASSRVVHTGMQNFDTTDRAGGEPVYDDATGALRSDASEIDRGTLGEPQTQPDDSAIAAVGEVFDGDPLAGEGRPLAPPRPDFVNPVDYFDWYRRFALRQTTDNAYDAYEVFMPNSFVDKPQPDWPEFRDMFNDRDHEGTPGPWDAAEHPDWAASNQAVRDVLDQFREATLHEGYSSGILLSKEAIEDAPDGKPLLMGMLLTQLGPHRKLVRATLADAWLLEDGKVSPDRMLDAWRTSLRGADHLYQGATLIENLVGMAETKAVQETARWALQRGVFEGDELESAL